MSFHEIREPLKRWVAGGHRAGIATLIGARRSSPRPPGARFAASDAGDVAGSISSGCVEGDLYERIQQVVSSGTPRVVEYGITDEQALEVGLPCGGTIEVLVASYESSAEVWSALAAAIEVEHPAILVTGVSESIRARTMLVLADGSVVGTLGAAALDARAVRRVRPLFERGGARTLHLSDEGPAVFAETYLPRPRLAIVGASGVAPALSRLADFVGFSVTVIDPRSAFAVVARFPNARGVVQAPPQAAFEEVGIDRDWSVVVLSHDAKIDLPALAAALRAGCRYVGLMGGASTQELRRAALGELGLPDETLARIRGPVGLDLGARTPEEIALSIVADLVAVRRGRVPARDAQALHLRDPLR